jgi:hypothetical protein
VSRALIGFQLTYGDRPKVTELLAQPRLAELATYARCLHANASLGILKDERVAMQPNYHVVVDSRFISSMLSANSGGS